MVKRNRVRDCVMAMCFVVPVAMGATPAGATPVYADTALAQAGVVSRSQAVAIALNAVGGGSVLAAVFEKQDHIPHWSIDIVGAKYEYEVWVGVTGNVLRIITQPK